MLTDLEVSIKKNKHEVLHIEYNLMYYASLYQILSKSSKNEDSEEKSQLSVLPSYDSEY